MQKLVSELRELLVAQITQELSAAHIYFQVALHLEGRSYPGAAKWFFNQAMEEHVHARKIAQHLLDRGEAVVLSDVIEPSAAQRVADPTSNALLVAFEVAEKLESENTDTISDIYRAAVREAPGRPTDCELIAFIQPLVATQTAELAEITEKLDVLHRIKDDAGALYQFDVNLQEE